MTNPTASRYLATIPENRTLADLISWIAANPDVARRRRDDMASALRKIAQALDQSPSKVPASPNYLNDRLAGFVPQSAGMTTSRWINVQSLARGALKLAGIASMPGRYETPMEPAWLALHSALPDASFTRGLSRLFRYCSAQHIRPDDVNDAIMAGYLKAMQTEGLIRRARQVHRTACLLWNKAAETIPSWPQTKVVVPRYSTTYILPWDTFPASLSQDIERYLTQLGGTDLYADHDFAPVRGSTVQSHRNLLREAAASFVHADGDPAHLKSLADLVQMDAVKRVLSYLQTRSKTETSIQMFRVTSILVIVAKHWVHAEPDELAKLTRLCKRLKPAKSGFSEKNRARLRQFDTDESVAAILNLPQRLANIVRTSPVSKKTALLMQTAVAIEILVMTPLRLKNLAELALGRHIIATGRGTMHLSISEADVKNSVPINRVLPKESAALLDLYVKKYRDLLVNVETDALFPGAFGGTKSKTRLREQLGETILHYTGLAMNPHLFRHFTAKHYLREHNGAFGTLRLVLSHKSVTTTEQFYCSAEEDHAFRQLDNHVFEKRSSSRSSKQQPTRSSPKGGSASEGRRASGFKTLTPPPAPLRIRVPTKKG